MTTYPHGIVEVVVSNTEFVTPDASCNLQVLCICRSQDGLVLFGTQKVDGMSGAILLHQMREVALKCRLGGVRPCNLNALAEGLEPLLFPKYCNSKGFNSWCVNPLLRKRTWDTSSDLGVTHAMLISGEDSFSLSNANQALTLYSVFHYLPQQN